MPKQGLLSITWLQSEIYIDFPLPPERPSIISPGNYYVIVADWSDDHAVPSVPSIYMYYAIIEFERSLNPFQPEVRYVGGIVMHFMQDA